MTGGAGGEVRRLARFGLTVSDAEALAAFYEGAFGARRVAAERLRGPRFETLMGVDEGASAITVAIGAEQIELMQFDVPGRPASPETSAADLDFQHFALVTADMNLALERLARMPGWSALSRGGPQRLPASSGGVTAFKFRDPDGHPLELLAFPPAETPPQWRDARAQGCLGIDHSAIGVADTARSIAFYQTLGLEPSAHSLNRGPEQARLDGLADPVVEVTAMGPRQPTPHVELLCYRSPAPRRATRRAPRRSNDIAATRLVFEAGGPAEREADAAPARRLADPDGHHLLIIHDGECAPSA